MPEETQNTEKLRAQAEQLLSQARAQSIEIQRALGAIAGDSALQSRLAEGATQISGVIGELSLALNSPGFALHQINLAALASVVHSDEIGALLTQARAQAKGSAALAEAVVTASAATRREAQNLAHDMFERRIFDPYLHFDSAEDEEAFRRREAEARKYITDQLARHTPEGDLNAGGGVLGQMLDAHSHGAGASPEFMPDWYAMAERAQRQRAAMRAAGQSTEEFDRNLAVSARGFLKKQGLSDAEIDERLARSASPVEALTLFLSESHAARAAEKRADQIDHPASATSPFARVEAIAITAPQEAPLSINMDAMDAKLKAAGLQVPDPAGVATEGHGLTATTPVAATLGLPR